MGLIFYDTETCGLHGMPVLIQWAEGDSEIKLHNIWKTPIEETIELIDYFMESDVCGFNLAFDHFHLSKIYSTLINYPDHSVHPEDIIDDLALHYEKQNRGIICLKPKRACDLMILARAGKYQSTMDRKEIRIRKIPIQLAKLVRDELEQRITFPDIYFARRANPFSERWKVMEHKKHNGEEDLMFRDVVLKFAPSSALKALAKDALGYEDNILLFKDVELPKKLRPQEYGYAPFALAHATLNEDGTLYSWNGCWADVIRHHFDHWEYSSIARDYAKKDVEITRKLYYHFESPEPGDVDSTLTCMVASVRWKGFAVDVEKLKKIKEKESEKFYVDGFKIPTAPHTAKAWLHEVMDEGEKIIVDTTKAVMLEEVAEWDDHPASIRAKQILEARQAFKEIDSLKKLILAERFHASFSVVGTLSGRMGGGGSSKSIESGSRSGDGLNSQGIKNTKEIRSCFPLSDEDTILCGGDFDGFEVTIAVAVFKDKKLEEDLKSGKKIHALFGQEVFTDMTYDEIYASKGTANDVYTKSKQAVFALLYGGEGYTLKNRLGVDIDTANEAYERFISKYYGIKKSRQEIANMFCSMKQVEGIGTRIMWNEPKDYVESILGFKRYFTLENRVCKVLFNLAENIPESWEEETDKVYRTSNRHQTVQGATRTAIFASAFKLQAANMRAAGNHRIQSTGATITKKVQFNIWKMQPNGCCAWRVQPLNIHDEIMCPTKPEYVEQVRREVNSTVEFYRKLIPLIKMDWETKLKNWGEK